MLIQICSNLTERFIRNGILDQSLTDWCIYWLQKKILTALAVSLMLILGSLIFGFNVTICFLLGLFPLRRRLIGYHTKSPYTCIILSVGIMLLALLVNSTFNQRISQVFSLVNFIICLMLVVCVLSDQTDPRLHLTREEVKENHRLAVQILALVSVAGVVVALLLHSSQCLSSCQMGIMAAVSSAAYNKLKQIKEASTHEKNH